MSPEGGAAPLREAVAADTVWAVLRGVLAPIGAARDERAVFEGLVREVADRLGFAWVSIVLGEPYERSPRLLLSVPTAPRAFWSGQRVDPRSGILEAIQSGTAFVRERVGPDDGAFWEDPGLRDLGVVAYAAIPLEGDGAVVGTFNVGATRADQVTGNLDLLGRLAAFATAAAGPARVITDLQRRLPRLAERASTPVPPDI
jgi:hypothetical protein